MPSANNRRNRRMRKLQAKAQAMEKRDLPDSRNSLSLAVAVDNKSYDSINPNKCPVTVLNSPKTSNIRDNCFVCNGGKCARIFRVGHCGCHFGNYCYDPTFMKDCPTCPFRDPNDAIDSFSRNVSGSLVEAGESASLALEAMAQSASNFMTSRGVDPFIYQHATIFDNFLPRRMNQQEQEAVVRNVRIARTVVGAAATATEFVANGVGGGLWALGSLLSPAVGGIAKKILSEWYEDEERAEHMVSAGMEIAEAAIITTGNVARGIQNGTGILASGVCRRLAHHYEKTYGFVHGELQPDVGMIAKNAVQTAWNVKAMQPKSKFAKISKIIPSSPDSEN